MLAGTEEYAAIRADELVMARLRERAAAATGGLYPGPANTHLAIGLAIRAGLVGHRGSFATASEWIDR